MKIQSLAAAIITCSLVFSGCTFSSASQDAQTSQSVDDSTSSTSHSEPAVSVQPGSGSASQSDNASSAVFQDITIDATDGVSYVFTVEQQATIAKQVDDAIKKYQSGEYPIKPGEGTDYAPYAQPWPDGVPYPESISPTDITITTEGFEMYGIGAKMELSDGYTMTITIYANKDLNESDPNYWTVDSIGFFKF